MHKAVPHLLYFPYCGAFFPSLISTCLLCCYFIQMKLDDFIKRNVTLSTCFQHLVWQKTTLPASKRWSQRFHIMLWHCVCGFGISNVFQRYRCNIKQRETKSTLAARISYQKGYKKDFLFCFLKFQRFRKHLLSPWFLLLSYFRMAKWNWLCILGGRRTYFVCSSTIFKSKTSSSLLGIFVINQEG